MIIRYAADAVIYLGEEPECAIYKAHYGPTIEKAVSAAENDSITNEAYDLRLETKEAGRWVRTRHIDEN